MVEVGGVRSATHGDRGDESCGREEDEEGRGLHGRRGCRSIVGRGIRRLDGFFPRLLAEAGESLDEIGDEIGLPGERGEKRKQHDQSAPIGGAGFGVARPAERAHGDDDCEPGEHTDADEKEEQRVEMVDAEPGGARGPRSGAEHDGDDPARKDTDRDGPTGHEATRRGRRTGSEPEGMPST